MRRIHIATVIIFLFSNWFLSKVLAQEIINDRLSLIETSTKFTSTPVPGAPAGTFTITAIFRNILTDNLGELAFRVVELTGGNLLLNADGGPGGLGSILTVPFSENYSDEILGPAESFQVDFVIGLASRARFRFVVEALGIIRPDLEFIFPYSGQEVRGDNVLVWVAEVGVPENLDRKVIFETSLDGQSFELLSLKEAPDLDVTSHTTGLDTTAFPTGPLFIRARFKDRDTGPILRVIVVRQEALITPTHEPFCGCEEMKVKTTGDSFIGDPRRTDDRGTPDESDDVPMPAPLGIDPDFLSFNFEIVATLIPGSDPRLCEEGQEAKGTFEKDLIVVHVKKACTAGLTLAICDTDSDCDTRTCIGGTQTGSSCDTEFVEDNCLNGGGLCESNNDGVCTEFPFDGPDRGNDDYKLPYPRDLGLKVHRPRPTWFDAPGMPEKNRADVQFDLLANWDFLAFVRGPQGSCSCHFQLTIDWDGTNQVHKEGTGLTLIFDEDTFKCVQQ